MCQFVHDSVHVGLELIGICHRVVSIDDGVAHLRAIGVCPKWARPRIGQETACAVVDGGDVNKYISGSGVPRGWMLSRDYKVAPVGAGGIIWDDDGGVVLVHA